MYNQGHGQKLYPTKPNVIGQRRYPTKVIQQRLSSIMLIKDYIPPMSSDKKVYHQDYIPQRLRSSDKDYKPPRSSDKGYIQIIKTIEKTPLRSYSCTIKVTDKIYISPRSSNNDYLNVGHSWQQTRNIPPRFEQIKIISH